MSLRQYCKPRQPDISIYPGQYKYELVIRKGANSFDTLRGMGYFSPVNDNDDEEGHLGEVNTEECGLVVEGDQYTTRVSIVKIRISSRGLCLICRAI